MIPRPPGARPGDPPAWADLPAERRRGLTLDRVRSALAAAGQDGPVPPPADESPVPPVAVLEPPEHLGRAGGTMAAAVLVALFEEEGESRVLLTRRSTRLRSHRGEVSFPGGRVDPGESAAAAALREASEEVALDPAAVLLDGWLHPLFTFSSSARISPVVGTLARRPSLTANPVEVERVFDVALADLVTDGVFHEERWHVPGRPAATGGPAAATDGSFPVWFFRLAGEIVWGATARVLHELVSLAVGVPPLLPGESPQGSGRLLGGSAGAAGGHGPRGPRR